MVSAHSRGRFRPASPAARHASLACLFGVLGLAGCQGSLFRSEPAQPPERPPPEIASADTGFTPVDPAPTETPLVAVLPRNIALTVAVLHVQVPATDAAAAANVWAHFNESEMDAATAERLSRNGIRAGVAHISSFEAIRSILDAIPGERVTQSTPLQVPAGYPVLLEMDAEPHDQTLFVVAADGVLSGGTWTASRNVLRIAYVPLPHDSTRVRFRAWPEVHQRVEGYAWIRTESGMWPAPSEKYTVFDAAALELPLDPDEFVLIAASDAARTEALIGSAMLARTIDAVRYHSYVFLRPQVTDVGQRN